MTGPGTDLYSLGCLLYEMLTGAPMFDGTTLEILEAHQRPFRPRADTGFDELDAFLSTLMAWRLEDRPSSAKEVASELTRLDAKLSERSTHVGPAPRAPPTRGLPPREPPPTAATTQQILADLERSNKSRRQWFAALGVAVLVLAWGLWFLIIRVEPVPEVTPVVTAPPPPVEVPPVEVVVDAGVAVEPGPEEEELEALVKLSRTAVEKVKPVVKKAPATVDVIVDEPCQPDERWKSNSRLSLSELRGRAAGNSRKFDLFEEREAEIAREIARASTASQCAGVEASLKRLLQELNE